MTRWQSDPRGRLERAALELFTEQGFAATTVPQIAARAGLTTRTFFRHFADKREVLFAEDDAVDQAVGLLREVPASLAPMTVVVEGLRAVTATRFEGRREELRLRRRIERSDPGLHERGLRKRASLTSAVQEGFVGRGLDPVAAAAAAEVGVGALYMALEQWLQDDDRPLFDLVLEALAAMGALLCDPPRPGPHSP